MYKRLLHRRWFMLLQSANSRRSHPFAVAKIQLIFDIHKFYLTYRPFILAYPPLSSFRADDIRAPKQSDSHLANRNPNQQRSGEQQVRGAESILKRNKKTTGLGRDT